MIFTLIFSCGMSVSAAVCEHNTSSFVIFKRYPDVSHQICNRVNRELTKTIERFYVQEKSDIPKIIIYKILSSDTVFIYIIVYTDCILIIYLSII